MRDHVWSALRSALWSDISLNMTGPKWLAMECFYKMKGHSCNSTKWNGTCFEAPDVPSIHLANVFKDLHGATSQSAKTCQNYPDISRSSFERPSATNCQDFRVCRSLSQQTQRHIENMSVHVSATLCWQLCRAQITANIKLLTRVSSAFWRSMSPTQGLGYPGLRLPPYKTQDSTKWLVWPRPKTTLNSNPYIIYRHFSLQNGSCISHGILTRWQGLHVHFWAKIHSLQND